MILGMFASVAVLILIVVEYGLGEVGQRCLV